MQADRNRIERSPPLQCQFSEKISTKNFKVVDDVTSSTWVKMKVDQVEPAGVLISFLEEHGLSLPDEYPIGPTYMHETNPGRFAPDPVRPLDVSPQRRFAPGRFAPGRFAPVVVSPLVDSPQEEKSTYFVESYVNS